MCCYTKNIEILDIVLALPNCEVRFGNYYTKFVNDEYEFAEKLRKHSSVKQDFLSMLLFQFQNITWIKKLLQYSDINPNIKDRNGDTLLIIACKHNLNKIAIELLKHSSIDTSIKDACGKTALSYACSNCNFTILSFTSKIDNIVF
jgi:ankyrin repeat protein